MGHLLSNCYFCRLLSQLVGWSVRWSIIFWRLIEFHLIVSIQMLKSITSIRPVWPTTKDVPKFLVGVEVILSVGTKRWDGNMHFKHLCKVVHRQQTAVFQPSKYDMTKTSKKSLRMDCGLKLWRQISPTTSRSSKWILTTAPHLLNFIGKLNRRFFAELVPYHCIYCFIFKEYTVFIVPVPIYVSCKTILPLQPLFSKNMESVPI